MISGQHCRDTSFHLHHPAVASRAILGDHCHADMPSTDVGVSGRALSVASIHHTHFLLAYYVAVSSEQVCHRWEADQVALHVAISVLWAVSDLLCGMSHIS
jgi:hypothetical protein